MILQNLDDEHTLDLTDAGQVLQRELWWILVMRLSHYSTGQGLFSKICVKFIG